MVDMGVLVGSIRSLGLVGPAYEILGPSVPGPDGEPQMRIHLFESGEDVDHAVADILNDPLED